MNDPKNGSESGKQYLLGHTDWEIERLKIQARIIGPVTERIFRAGGIAPGMRVLDVGSGVGDVAFLAADIVGENGEVEGADVAAAGIEVARARAAARAVQNVTFHVGDPAEMTFDRPFDAVLGRYVLQFQRDPSAMLKKLAAHVKPGGVVVFHEIDWGGVGSYPPAPTFDQVRAWGLETLRAHGTESRMGVKLFSAFVGAGLPPPLMRLEALIGGGENAADIIQIASRLAGTLLPESERLGITSSAEVGLPTLAERMNREVAAGDGVVIGHFQVGAWARVPG